MAMENQSFLLFFMLKMLLFSSNSVSAGEYISALGDPGMIRDGLRVAFEAWNFCNEVGSEAPEMGSPRAADCFDFSNYSLEHKVTEADNRLGVGKPFPGLSLQALNNMDLYAAEKELYLGSLCEAEGTQNPWHFWMVMLKNGNFDTMSGLCPQNGKRVGPFPPTGRFPCFGSGCMNQPILYHQQTNLVENGKMKGGFSGTYDLGVDFKGGIENISYFEVVWEKKIGVGSWSFKHKVKTSRKYPWLMLYLRADATKGFSGGYHYQTRGMMKTLPESPYFKVKLSLNVKQGGGPKSQFYLMDIGSCWKNNGAPCDGDVLTDVTRYSEMIINPQTPAWCSPTNLNACPPYHITPQDKKIHRNDTANFPYAAYHYYCSPGNAMYLEQPSSTCDPYSNPQAQELVQILPHPIWADYGYPTKQGEGWIGDPRTWMLDVGGLSSRLYFYQAHKKSLIEILLNSARVEVQEAHLIKTLVYTFSFSVFRVWKGAVILRVRDERRKKRKQKRKETQRKDKESVIILDIPLGEIIMLCGLGQNYDPGTPPARRIWASIDVGTEIFISGKDEIAEWTLSDFDVILTSPQK